MAQRIHIEVEQLKSRVRNLLGRVATLESSGGFSNAAGSNTEIQYNNEGVFGASPNLTFDGTTLTVAQDAEVDGTLIANHIHGNIAGAVYIHVKNTSGVTISAGSPVYATGSVGASDAVEIAASDASNANTMPALGILQTALNQNDTGHVTILGLVHQQNTSSYPVNTSLYVAPGGGLTSTRPTATTDLVQKIGRVVRSDASTGEILVLGAGRTNDIPNNVDHGNLSGLGDDDHTQYPKFTANTTAPVSPRANDLWYNTTSSKLYFFYDDGLSPQWVEIVGSGSSGSASSSDLANVFMLMGA